MACGSRWLQKIFWRSDESGFERRVGVLQLFVLATMEVTYGSWFKVNGSWLLIN